MQVPAFPCTRKLILPKNTIDELIFCLLSTIVLPVLLTIMPTCMFCFEGQLLLVV